MTETRQLLDEYARNGSEAAFRELVSRYVDLVHSAALRLVNGDTHLAQDVTQTVFADLARKAPALSRDVLLGGWLHRHACYVAHHTLRAERRRQSRERQAVEMNALNDTAGDDPAQIAQLTPLLDDAINRLGDADRTAILLRFFEQRDFRSVGEALGASENTARMRVNRALDKLQVLLKHRGVTLSAATLGALLTAHAVNAAPAGLALSISTGALATAHVAGTTIATTAAKTIAMTTIQKTVVTAVIVAALGAAVYETRQSTRLREQNQALLQDRAVRETAASNAMAVTASLQNQLDDLTRQNSELTGSLARANSNLTQLNQAKTQAELVAHRYRELAGQLNAGDKNSTNRYPTMRHAIADIGRLARMAIELKKVDMDKLSPGEKSANVQAKMQLVSEFMKAGMAIRELDDNQPEAAKSAKEDPADIAACGLYGALNLDEQQFASTYGILQKYYQQAETRNLLPDQATPETDAALKELNANLSQEIQALLTADQAAIFTDLLAPNGGQLVSKKFNLSFNFSDGDGK